MIVTIASTVKQLSLIGQRKKCRKILKTTLIKNSNKQLMCTCKRATLKIYNITEIL